MSHRRTLNALSSGSYLLNQSTGGFLATLTSGSFGLLFWLAAASLRPVEIVGRLSVAAPIAQLAGLAAAAGTGAYLAVRIPSVSPRQWRMLLLTASLSTATVALLVGFVSLRFLDISGTAVAVILVVGPLAAVGTVVDGALIATGRAWIVAGRHGLSGALRLALVVLTPSSLETIWVASTLLALIPAISVVLSTRSVRSPQVQESEQRRGIRVAMHHHLVSLLTAAPYLMAPWVVDRFTGPSAAAAFYITLQFGALLSAVSSSIGAAALPAMARDVASRPPLLSEALRLSRRVTIVGATLTVVFAPLSTRLLGSALTVDRTALGIILVGEIFASVARIGVVEERVNQRLMSALLIVGAGAIVAVAGMFASSGEARFLALALAGGNTVGAMVASGMLATRSVDVHGGRAGRRPAASGSSERGSGGATLPPTEEVRGDSRVLSVRLRGLLLAVGAVGFEALYRTPTSVVRAIGMLMKLTRTRTQVMSLAELSAGIIGESDSVPSVASTTLHDVTVCTGVSGYFQKDQLLMSTTVTNAAAKHRAHIFNRYVAILPRATVVARAPDVATNSQFGLWMGGFGYTNWFHWMLEQCAGASNAIRCLKSDSPELLVPLDVASSPNHVRLLRYITEGTGSRIRWVAADAAVHIECALVPRPVVDSVPHLRGDAWPVESDVLIDRQGLARFRDGLLHHVNPDRYEGPARIYLSRRSGKLRPSNDEEVFNAIADLGFVRIDPAELSIDEQAGLFQSADVVVGATGAGWTNLVFASRSTRSIIWTPGRRINGARLWERLSESAGSTVTILHSDAEPATFTQSQSRYFYMDPSRVRQAIKALDS